MHLNHSYFLQFSVFNCIFFPFSQMQAKMQHGGLTDMSGESDWVLTVFTALSTVVTVSCF